MNKIMIEACPKCDDPAFMITEGELDDAEGWVECDLCGTRRNPIDEDQESYMRYRPGGGHYNDVMFGYGDEP